MEKTDRSDSVELNSQRYLDETPSRTNNKTEPTGVMNDAAQLDFVREWISRNYGDSVAHSGASSYACEDKESLPFSVYHRNKPFRRYESMDRSSRGSPMGANHVELLRKLEHLKMEISRIYEVPEKTGKFMLFPEDRVMNNSRPRPFAHLSPAEHYLYPKNHFGQFPCTTGSNNDMKDIYSHPGYSPSYHIAYRDCLKPQMRRPSHQFASNPVMESPIREGMGFGEDLFATYARDPFPHPPTCSCLSCSQKYHQHFHSSIHQTTFGIGGTPKSPSTFGSYHRTDSAPMWPPHGVVSVVSPPVRSHHSRLPGSWPNDIHLDMDNLRSRRNSVPVNQGIKKYCHPLAGGAPFTTCPKCCELLKLPHVFKLKRLSVYNLQCGSCFNMFQVDLGNRKRDTFLTREFPLPDGTGSNEAMDERNWGPRRHSMADGTICGESNVSEAYPASADSLNLKFQQGKSDLGEKSESRELSARMSQRSGSITSVSSEDPMLSNVVLRGRILRDVYKHENPTEAKELNARVDLCSKSLSTSSVSSYEQHMPSDAISRRIVEEDSVQKNRKENKDMNGDGRRFAVHSVSSEEQKLSNEIIVSGIPEEGVLRINQTGKELNGGIDLNSLRLAASSVSSEKQDLSSHVIIGRTPHEESQQNYPMEKRDSSEIMGQQSETFTASFHFSEKLNTSDNVIAGPDVTNAAMEPSQSMTEIKVAERDTKSSQKENTLIVMVAEPEVDFSFVSRVSSNEYMDDGCSSDQNSQLNIGKWSESSLVSFIRKSYNDLSRQQQNEDDEMTNVTINGHPMTKEDIKRAEMLAGRVLPGHYWYDYFGGFWGVMGEPCLGIISPFIEEFNYPLRANCAAGNTDVFVNGRELHQIDLELLATRGLPTARNRSYKIDICGTVYDEKTGEELKSLGLLAPTVIKAKRGFGMGVPRNMNSM